MRYINLLTRVSRVRTTHCFLYNNTIIFAVPRPLIRKAVGGSGKNIKELQKTIGKRVKIIGEVRGPQDLERFIQDLVDPATFKSVDINGEQIIINSGNRTKAATLIGRNKIRLDELAKIIMDVFGKELKII